MNNETEKLKEKDFLYNRVSSSRFLFYITVFSALSFISGASYQLWQHRYEGKPKVEIQSSSQFTPEYK